MKIKKRAVASLIGWVLLVGLTVTLAGVVTNWAIKNAKRFQPEKFAGPDIYCDSIAISFEDNMVKNRGSLTITNILCAPEDGEPRIIENLNLKPGGEIASPCTSKEEIIPGTKNSKEEVIYCPMKGFKIE